MANLDFGLPASKEIKPVEVPLPSPATTLDVSHREHKRDDSNPSSLESPYAEHGAPINRSNTADQKKPANAGLAWPRIRRAFREPLSEFMGTFILIMFGDGVVAQVVLSNGTHGDYQSISWGWVSLVVAPCVVDQRLTSS